MSCLQARCPSPCAPVGPIMERRDAANAGSLRPDDKRDGYCSCPLAELAYRPPATLPGFFVFLFGDFTPAPSLSVLFFPIASYSLSSLPLLFACSALLCCYLIFFPPRPTAAPSASLSAAGEKPCYEPGAAWRHPT